MLEVGGKRSVCTRLLQGLFFGQGRTEKAGHVAQIVAHWVIVSMIHFTSLLYVVECVEIIVYSHVYHDRSRF